MMKGLGAYIRELRVRPEVDLSLREFAQKLGYTPAFISDVELGRRFPSEKVLAEMALILKTSIANLKAHDVRPPIEEIKKATASNPTYALAFRMVIDKKISPEQILKLAGKAKARTKKSQHDE